MKPRCLTFIICSVFALVAFAKAYSPREIPNVHVENRTRYVSNPDNILSPQTVTALDSTLSRLWRKSSAEAVVVVVNNIDGDIDDFATELFSQWGVGKKDKDNGLLFLISVGDRKAAIRTGYGMEGIVPDIIAGRIIRNIAFPRFREGDYDGGITAAVDEITRLTTTPGATEELMSRYANDEGAAGNGDENFIKSWLGIGVFIAAVMMLWFLWILFSHRHDDRYGRYNALKKMVVPGLLLGFIGMGVPFITLLIVWLTMRFQRTRRRICPNCHHKMRRLDEQTDNQYLTPAQDLEEKLDSVDYDVWLCDTCGETDIIPFVNQHSMYQVCPKCGARAMSLRAARVLRQPTEYNEGVGLKDYVCRNCGHLDQESYTIPKVVVPPIIILPPGGGRGGGGFGGGGFSGGSFGGGMTGGGGASGGW